MVLEAACASCSLVATAVTALIAATGATPALPARPLKAIVNVATVHTTTHTAAILRVHASASTSANLIVAIAATRSASWTIVSWVAYYHVAVASASTVAPSSTTLMKLFTSASAVAAASVIATAMVVGEATATRIARSSLILPTGASAALAIAHRALVSHYTTARLQAQVFWDRVVYVTQFSIAVSILAVLVPLTEALVLKVATLLSLEALVDRTVLYGSIGLLLHLWLHLLLHHLLRLTWSTDLRLYVWLSGLLHLHLLLLLRVHHSSHRLLLLLNDGVGILG